MEIINTFWFGFIAAFALVACIVALVLFIEIEVSRRVSRQCKKTDSGNKNVMTRIMNGDETVNFSDLSGIMGEKPNFYFDTINRLKEETAFYKEKYEELANALSIKAKKDVVSVDIDWDYLLNLKQK